MRRIGFAVMLAVVSTYFAECTITNDSIVGNLLWAVASMVPLYGLHALILGRMAFRRGTPAFPTLFLCAMLFGLYEAYITKVLWTGFDKNDPLKVAGVSAAAFLILVPWWHAFMAFMMPLVFVERYALGWREDTALLPKRLRSWMSDAGRARWTWTALGVFFGLYQSSVGMGKPLQPFLGLADMLIMLAVVHFWKAREDESLQTMLPSGRGLKVAIVWLVGLYVLSIVGIRRELMPGVGPQLAILGCYALIGLLLVRSYRPVALPESGVTKARVSVLREVTPFPFVWFGTALVTRLVPGLPIVSFLVCTAFGIGLGLWCLGRTLRRLAAPCLPS